MRVLLGLVLLGAGSMHGGSTAQHLPADTAAPSLLSSSPAGCLVPASISRTGGSQDQQDAAFAWASRGSLRRAVPCFAAALQQAAQHAWLWVDYARALQGAVRTEEQAVRGCDGAANLRLWGAELGEAQAASHVALLLDDQRDLDAARLVQRRIAKTYLRHGALVSRCANNSSGLSSNASRQSGSNTAWLVASLVNGRPRSLRDAVELGNAWCTGPRAATVSLAAGWASATSVRDALLALRLCGVVRLQRVWHPSALDAVATAHRREFEDYLRRADMDPSTNVTGDSQGRATRHGVQRWRGRWESVLPFAPPFNDPALTMNPSLLAVLQSGLGSARLELDTFTQITSIGGAGSQPFHADVGPLWPQQRGQQVEPHGLVCVVPLMNVSSESRGPTAFQVASHFLPPVSDIVCSYKQGIVQAVA